MIWLLACAGDAVDPVVTERTPNFEAASTGDEVVELEALQLARRISLDLRGTLPSLEEYERVQADPEALDALQEEWLTDPAVEERLVRLFGEQFLTRVDEFNTNAVDYGYGDDGYAFARAVGEEPLRLMARVAVTDRSWTEIVTADWTMANEYTGDIFVLDYPESQTGWEVAHYQDGRPAGGVVMTNGLWWRYYTTPNNYSRSRASAITRLLLCEDFLLRPVSFDAPAVTGLDELNDAVKTEPGCVGCHSSLDPLASSLFGFWWYDLYSTVEMTRYHPSREHLGEVFLDTEPAWFGTPLYSPAELGPMIAEDPRLMTCAVERGARAFWRRDPVHSDEPELQELFRAFEASDYRYLDLLAAILDSPSYRAGGLVDGASETAAEVQTTRRLMSVDLMESSVEDATGFVWIVDGWRELDNDTTGYRVLAGGVDGKIVGEPLRAPTVGLALVLLREAEVAASLVVAEDLAAPVAERRLLGSVELDDRPGDEAFEDTLASLHLRLHAIEADAATLALDGAHWEAVEALEGPAAAWESLITVMLRDPAFWTY